MKFQTMLSNGEFVNDSRLDYFVQLAAQFNGVTKKQVLEWLAAGEEVRYDTDWYAVIRDADAVEQTTMVNSVMVECDCGHCVEGVLVMCTSRGTSCPDCYDRMSD